MSIKQEESVPIQEKEKDDSKNIYYPPNPGAYYQKQNQINGMAGYDTIHYLSPATSEGSEYDPHELDYRSLVKTELDRAQYNDGFDARTTSSSTIICGTVPFQRTLAIVKPDAMPYKDVILRAIRVAGLNVLNERVLHLTPEQVSELYASYYGSPAFPLMVCTMSVEPVLVLSLAGHNAVEKWKMMVGPRRVLPQNWFFPLSVRRRFKVSEDIPEAVHCAEDLFDAEVENRYFFPKSIVEPIIHEKNRIEDFCKLYVTPTLSKGLTEILRKKPIDPIVYLADWLLKNNPFRPRMPANVELTPT